MSRPPRGWNYLARSYGLEVEQEHVPLTGEVDLNRPGLIAIFGHNGRLPYLTRAEMRNEFNRVATRAPWASELMRAFRSGQLLVSPDLMEVVGERFSIDMSMPDTERDGPYGGAAGCGTTIPFRYGRVLEIPLTLPQDVFLRHVYGLSAQEALAVWLDKLAYVRAAGGVAVLNIHPVWVSAKHPDLFRAFSNFLEHLAGAEDVLVTTPSQLEASLSLPS